MVLVNKKCKLYSEIAICFPIKKRAPIRKTIRKQFAHTKRRPESGVHSHFVPVQVNSTNTYPPFPSGGKEVLPEYSFSWDRPQIISNPTGNTVFTYVNCAKP